jgi:CBS domain containing-hemolysin-like protein
MDTVLIILAALILIVLFSWIRVAFTNPENLRVELDSLPVAEETETYQNIRIFRNVLDLSNLRLREIMVPRTEIEAVPIDATVDQLRETFVSTRFARILVYQDTIDNIAGYFEVKDIFKNPPDIRSAVRKLAIAPETMAASKLLKTFVDEKRNIALVVDEFGGTSGMITLEDLLEEIVGDIEDEHDTSDFVEKTVRQNEFIFSGRLEIDYLNEKYKLELPEGDEYATLAGMILFHHGSIPVTNDIVRIGNIVIRILRANATRIEVVNLRIETAI